MTIPRDTEAVYTYGIDHIIKEAHRTTPADELLADEVFAHAQAIKPLPTGYIVKAIIKCNQIDTFRMVACDWRARVETQRERVQAISQRRLADHLRHAHPYLSIAQRSLLVRVISFNFKDVGR